METNHNFLQTGGQPVSDRMRELLARAAQDHVYSQRSSGGQALDDIRQRLEGVEWALREVREGGLGGLTGQLDGVRGQVEELSGKPPGWAEGLAEHIEAVGERVKPVAELPALWADVGVMAENVDEALARVQTAIDSAERIAEATRQASQRMEEMAKRLDRLQGGMEAASVRFNRLDKSLAELGHRAERLDHSINAVSTRVDHALGEMADRVEQGLEAVTGRVEGVGGRLDGLDGRLEGLSGKLDGRLAALDELQTKVNELVRRPAFDHGDRFDALEKHLADAVDPLLEQLRARPDRDEVEATVARHVDRRAESVEDHITRAHEDMLKRLCTLEETMLALAEALLRTRREDKD
ncbi:hypothetical protein Acsp03_15410 [Actinomadura sp. NBRC 104412]|uniref:hypothetical protein n=1 Tax=Actinomadura sp. NBRC 104412 TaxID=3032203 RepID=UPI0024A1A0BD|nr:hypothetical protein [Actinomadura sp. NBRC 104412]GLZ04075.1 hypothetical protein Acsp03_15410 [Actinomadura sp. NBRC 104412]